MYTPGSRAGTKLARILASRSHGLIIIRYYPFGVLIVTLVCPIFTIRVRGNDEGELTHGLDMRV